MAAGLGHGIGRDPRSACVCPWPALFGHAGAAGGFPRHPHRIASLRLLKLVRKLRFPPLGNACGFPFPGNDFCRMDEGQQDGCEKPVMPSCPRTRLPGSALDGPRALGQGQREEGLEKSQRMAPRGAQDRRAQCQHGGRVPGSTWRSDLLCVCIQVSRCSDGIRFEKKLATLRELRLGSDEVALLQGIKS